MQKKLLGAAILASLVLPLVSGCTSGSKPAVAVTAPPSVAAPRHHGPATPTPTNKPAQTTHLPDHDQGQLRAYYRKKYTAEERASVESMMGGILKEYSPQERSQAVAEILSYDQVVFHQTQWHHLDRNHKVVRANEALLKEMCRLHDVPFLPVLGIVSWENSGGTTRESGVGAVGLGQMTWGAVEEAHRFAAEDARQSLEKAKARKRVAELTGDPRALAEARELASRASRMDVAARHREISRKAHAIDERFVAECNAEDVALFFKMLVTHYGGRVDHAIGAYHKGMANQDDIIYDYLRRKEPGAPSPDHDPAGFLAAIQRNNVTYIDLWNDLHTRQMLNGLRTMDGEVTTAANRSQALGDEADLYPWKVLGSLAAYQQGQQYVERMIARYSPPREVAETDGLPMLGDLSAFEQEARAGKLVRTKVPMEDLGVAGSGSAKSREYAYYVTPELEGYLLSLTARLRDGCGDDQVKLPVRGLSDAGALESGKPINAEIGMHLRGVAASLNVNSLPPAQAAVLEAILQADYLSDRIYRDHNKADGTDLVCLNPRYGNEFLQAYEKRGALASRPSTARASSRVARTAPVSRPAQAETPANPDPPAAAAPMVPGTPDVVVRATPPTPEPAGDGETPKSRGSEM